MPENILYPKSSMMVRKQNVLYPVTHVFVVKQTADDWLDSFTGGILECYNCFSWGVHDAITTVMGSHRPGESVDMSVTFAVNNLNYEFVPWTIGDNTLYDLYGDSVGWEFAAYTWDGADDEDDFDHYTEMTGLMIGGMESAFNGAVDNRAHYGGGNNKIVTLSTSTPRTGRAFHVVERWNPSLERTKDLVFWLYDFSFTSHKITDSDGDEHMTMYYSYPPGAFPAEEKRLSYSFQTDGSNYPISDELFLPGQRGQRIISNNYKYEPWNRYPGLL